MPDGAAMTYRSTARRLMIVAIVKQRDHRRSARAPRHAARRHVTRQYFRSGNARRRSRNSSWRLAARLASVD